MPASSNGTRLTREPTTLEAEAQEVLDELWAARQVPFKLTVAKLVKGVGEHTIRFQDSPICRALIPLIDGQSFRDLVRAAILARVARMSEPLNEYIGQHSDH